MLIVSSIILSILSIHFNRNFDIVIPWISIIFFLAWWFFYKSQKFSVVLFIIFGIFGLIYGYNMGILWFLLPILFPMLWGIWFCLWHLIKEISLLICRAVKWEKVFNRKNKKKTLMLLLQTFTILFVITVFIFQVIF